MRKKDFEKYLAGNIDEKTDIPFDYSEVKKEINFSQFDAPEKSKFSPRRVFLIVGSVAAAVAIMLLAPVLFMPMANSAAGNQAYDNAVNSGATRSVNEGAIHSANDEAYNAQPSEPAHLSGKSAHANGFEEYLQLTSIILTEIKSGYLPFESGRATFVTADGEKFEVSANVAFFDSEFQKISLVDFYDGEFVSAIIAVEDGENVSAYEVIGIKKT